MSSRGAAEMRVSVGALVLAAALAALSLLPPRAQDVPIGRPGDAAFVSGFSLPSQHLIAFGRWSRGEGVLRLPRTGAAAVVSLSVAAPDARVPDAIRIVVNGVQVQPYALAAGWNDIDVPIDPRFANEAIELRLQSALSAGESGEPPRGVFLRRAVVRTGGVDLWRRTPPIATGLPLTIAWIGILACVWLLVGSRPLVSTASEAAEATSARHGVAGRRGAFIAGVLIGFAATVAFRPALLAHVVAFASLSCLVALVLAVASWRRIEAAAHRVSPPRAAILFAIAGLVLIAALFPDAFLRGHVLSQADMFYEYQPWASHVPDDYRPIDRPPLGDVPMLVYPFAKFAQATLRQGIFPLWTSAISAGQPFLATYQSALLSPFTFVAAIVPLPQATVLIATLRLLVGGLGMFLFLRAIGVSRLASAFGGVTFLLNPFTVVWLEHPLGGVPPWLPWMLLAGERLHIAIRSNADALRTSSVAHARIPGGAMAALALTTALVLAGGHPHTGMFVAMLGGGYAMVRALSTPAFNTIALTAIALMLGIALVALQVLPFLEYVSLSRAAATRADYPLNPFIAPTSTLITAIVPNFLGHHSSGNFAGPTNYLEQQIYPGIATWLLAAVGLATGLRAWRVWFFAAAALLAALVMYGAPGIHQIVSSLPLIKVASLPRTGIVTIGALAVLAAIGLDAILDARHEPAPAQADGRRRHRDLITIVIALVAIVIIGIALDMLHSRAAWLDRKGLLDFTTRWTWLSVSLVALVASIAIARLWLISRRAVAGVALIVIASLDLLLFGRGFHPLMPADRVFPVLPEIAMVQQDRDLFRVVGAGGALMPNAAMTYGFQDVRGYDGLLVARYADLLDAAFRYEHHTHLATNLQSPLLDLLNVKYVFGVPQIEAPEDWYTKLIVGSAPLYRNNRVFPRAFLVDGYAVMDGNPARRTLRDGRVDFHRVALVEQELPPESRPVAAATPDAVGRATITAYADHRVEIETDAPDRRLLILMDVHYPGWVAAIDGQPVPIPRANFAFRAVSVPGGRHTVRFTYRPTSFRIGLAISGVALLVIATLVVTGRRRARSHA